MVAVKSQVSRLGKQRGQGMTEYIIIVALIAVAAISAFKFFGNTVRTQLAGVAHEVAGDPTKSVTAITAAKATADKTKAEGARDKGMADYTN